MFKRFPPFVVFVSVLVLAMLACNAPTKQAVPTQPVNLELVPESTPVGSISPVSADSAEAKSSVKDGVEPDASTDQNAAPQQDGQAGPVDCTVATYTKDEGGYHHEIDANIVLGNWNRGASELQVAKICDALKAKGVTAFDVHEDLMADNNLSFLMMSANFSWEEIKALAKDLGDIQRVGAVHDFPGGPACIEYDFENPNPAYGPIKYFQLYDRKTWESRPEYYCPALAALPSPTPAP